MMTCCGVRIVYGLCKMYLVAVFLRDAATCTVSRFPAKRTHTIRCEGTAVHTITIDGTTHGCNDKWMAAHALTTVYKFERRSSLCCCAVRCVHTCALTWSGDGACEVWCAFRVVCFCVSVCVCVGVSDVGAGCQWRLCNRHTQRIIVAMLHTNTQSDT